MQVISRLPSETAAARIGPLAVLPVFLDLRGKRAVVAGGSEAAAWKAELLLAAGAEVELFAEPSDLADGMEALIQSQSALRHHPRGWEDGDLAGAAVALADAENEAEAVAFEAAARRAGAACNIVDRPEFCHFQFGTIVNRSPVVVGISTSGAAPILAQAIRRRIETLLPPWLADWAQLAARVRVDVTTRLSPDRRRAFWERLADRAFIAAPQAGTEAALGAPGLDVEPAAGHVTFVGAGPGDAELLTLKAVRALQAADVILFDDLVSDDVLELARREAKRILVGKRAGRPSCQQSEINALTVKLARAGRRVVRLKSGDPMIFGRAGEEIEQLRAAGIGFDVVPGITAGIAMAAALGISLTHRDHAKSVRFVTGHSRKGGLPEDVDWAAIADPSATTIFYMAGRTATEIAARLMCFGVSGDMPVAVAASIGRPDQVIRTCRLNSLAETVARIGLDNPLVIGIGWAFSQRSGSVEAPVDQVGHR
jgi:uroporphyrin-III C-methyltransferase/precorrin-2 dehydrogenase/sirohydrochlorin ferrochelatase